MENSCKPSTHNIYFQNEVSLWDPQILDKQNSQAPLFCSNRIKSIQFLLHSKLNLSLFTQRGEVIILPSWTTWIQGGEGCSLQVRVGGGYAVKYSHADENDMIRIKLLCGLGE